MMNIRIPLFLKIGTPLVLLIVLTVGLSGYRVYQESTQHWQAEMDTRLERLTSLVASTVMTDTLQLVHTPADLGGPAYTAVKKQLDQAVAAGGLSWVGIYYREGDHLYYWVDYSETGVGYPFLYATPEHLAVYDDLRAHRVQYADEFGSYYGFDAPIIVPGESGPKVLGIVEAVIEGESAQLLQRDALNRVLPILIGGSVIAVIASVAFTNLMFHRPLRRLQRGALALARGEFGHRIDLRSRDELGDLAATFNQMAAEIERLYQERLEMERRRREEEVARLKESERILETKVAERTAELVYKNGELVRAQQELAAARDQAVEANNAKSEFISLVSHELRIPMTSIKGYTDLLAAGSVGPINETQANMLRTIRSNAERMATLVSDLADISRIESGRLRLECRPLPLAEVVEEVTSSAHRQIEERQLQLTVHLADDLPPIFADRTRLAQILTNLVSNAYKYTPPGGQITIRAERKAGVGDLQGTAETVRVSVTDTGIGISPEDQPKIFQKFFRADDQQVRDVPGTGLGLSITQSLVEMQGGRIWLESEYGRGATFHFTVPCA